MADEVIEDYFVCIGAQKSGTTWLARVLASHPELFLTPVKEIHYFDHVHGITEHLNGHKRRSRYRKYFQKLLTQWGSFSEHRSHWGWFRRYMASPIDDRWYRGLFADRGGRRFAGEVTPEYAILGVDGLRHIRDLAPEARVLFIMRNPVERAWSQLLHQCRSRGLDANRQSIETIITMLGEERFEELGDYRATLDAMGQVFRPDQTLAVFYEDMHKDRLAGLEQVCRFIGITFDPLYFGELGRRFNRSQEAALPDAVRAHLRQHYRPQAEAVRQRLGRVPDAWTKEFGLGGSGDVRAVGGRVGQPRG